MNPIWKDYFVNFGDEATTGGSSVEFAVELAGEIIYQGRMHRRPGQDDLLVKINDICADHIKTPELLTEQGFSPYFYDTFFIFNVTAGWDTMDEVVFYNDWSYEEYEDSEILSIPINGRMTNRMLLPVSVTTNPNEKLTLEVLERTPGGVPSFRSIIVEGDGDGMGGVYMVDLSSVIAGADMYATIRENAQVLKYKCVDSCARYALYYVNARGGWDALLMEGNHSVVDSLTRHTRNLEYDNTNPLSRGKVNFANEIQKRMTLHTSWLTDEESSRMHHLLNSNNVFLYDMEEGKFIPVIMTNTTTEYKTYKGNGGKLVNYAIEVELANDRVRK